MKDEKKGMLSELEKMQKYLALAVEPGRVAVWGYDVKKDRMYNVLGDIFEKDGLPLAIASEEVYPADRERLSAAMNRLINGESTQESIRIRYRNYHTGEFEYIDKQVTVVLDEEGKVDQIIGTHKDISEEVEYRREKEKYIAALNFALKATDLFIYTYDVKSNTFYVLKDGKFVKSKITREEVFEQVHPDDRDEYRKSFNWLMTGVQTSLFKTYRMFDRKSNSFHYYEVRLLTMKDPKGGVSQISGSLKDVTKMLKLNNDLEDLLKRNSLIMNNISSGIVYLDKSFSVQWENMREVFGEKIGDMYKEGDFCYHSFGYDEPCPDCPAKRAFETKRKASFMFKIGTLHFFEVIANPASDNAGSVIGVVLKIEDVTQREEMLKKLRESDKQKSAFVANMSHEIRNPINAIVGFSQLLKDAETAEERDEYYSIIKKNSDMMMEIVSGILDISKIESGVIELKNDLFGMSQFMEEAYMSLKQYLTNPDVEFILDTPAEECVICMDRVRLMQIITNFVTNAFKFTQHGHIKIGYRYADAGVRMYCEDTGMGMTEAEVEKVFDRFFKTNVNNPNGTGLGMPICKAIMTAKRGRIWVDSEKGKGSTFRVWFPSERY